MLRAPLRLAAATMTGVLAAASGAQSADSTPYPTPPSKKGLQVQMVDDAVALGIRHAALNVVLTTLPAPDGDGGALTFAVGERTFAFDRVQVAALDAQVEPLTAAGIVVTAILLAVRTGEPHRDARFVHPRCIGTAPNGIAAFDTVTPEGRAWLDATVAFLADRYSGREAPHGRIWNWIVGNEVNAHWWWYHLGRAPLAEVVDTYEAAVRIVHGAVRRHSLHARVFVSLEHHWTMRFAAGDEQQAAPGRDLLRAFAACARARGDFDWHVAFHPYPENLFDCRFWRDSTAPDADDAPRVTFRNLPVLLRCLADEPLRHGGDVRRVILSEQGFHCRDDADGERDQAAAFALAWSIVDRLPGIDALILHRHVDHAHEHGLRLGLWSRRPDSVSTPLRRRRIADVFLACDTPAWPECASFALPVIGIERFDDWPLGATGR